MLHQYGYPVASSGKQFCTKLTNASSYVRELHAIITDVQKWRHYLLGQRFVIEISQKSLKELMGQIVQTLINITI